MLSSGSVEPILYEGMGHFTWKNKEISCRGVKDSVVFFILVIACKV